MKDKISISATCVSCDACRLVCPDDAVFTQRNDYFIEDWSCTRCGLCIFVCPVDAIKVKEIKD